MLRHDYDDSPRRAVGSSRGYEALEIIGRGSFGCAMLARDARGRRKVMKIIELQCASERRKREAPKEAEIMEKLKHPYIVRIHETFVEDTALVIVMEYAGAGDLRKQVKDARLREISFQELKILRWMAQAFVGLRHIHSMSILHRDLKSENLFLENEDRVRIGDFGIACAVKASHKVILETNVVGTPYYMSPETCSMGLHSFAGDVWAMGCVLYELAALKLPYHGDTLEDLMSEITRKAAPRFPITYSAELAQIYGSVMSHNRNKRPSASDVLFMQPLHQTLESLLRESEKAKSMRPASAPPDKRAAEASCGATPQEATVYPSLEAAPDEGSPAQMPGTAAPFRRLQELRRNIGTPLPVLCAAAPPEEILPPLRPSSARVRSASCRKESQPPSQVLTPRIPGDCQRLLQRRPTSTTQAGSQKPQPPAQARAPGPGNQGSRGPATNTLLNRRLVMAKASALDAAKSLSQAVARSARQALRRGTQQPNKVAESKLTGIVQEVFAESATASRSQVRSRAMVRSESEPPAEIYAE